MSNPLRIDTDTVHQHADRSTHFSSAGGHRHTPSSSRGPGVGHTPSNTRGPGVGHSKSFKRAATTTPRHTKFEDRTNSAPVYEHGNETLGEFLVHPLKQMKAHKERIKLFRDATLKFNQRGERDVEAFEEEAKKEVETKIVLVIHFKRLTGDHTFKLSSEQQESIASKLNFSQEEKGEFAVIEDSDSLMAFLDKYDREYITKIHRADELEKEEREAKEKQEHASAPKDEVDLGAQSGSQKPSNDAASTETLKDSVEFPLNDNMHIEVKRVAVVEKEEEVEDDGFDSGSKPFFAVPDPDLSDDLEQEKSASWLELFYDLFYIASLSQFTHEHHIVDSGSLGVYAGWFAVIWWSWTASSLYTSRFDTNDVVHHIYRVVEMCAVVGMAGASEKYIDAPNGFIIGYMVLKAVLVVEYSVVFIVALISGSKSRYPLLAYVLANMISLVFWGVSLLFVTEETLSQRFALWYLSIAIEIVINIAFKDSKQVSLGASHIAERFGLLTLIVLGENLIGFVKLVAAAGMETRVVIANMLAVVIIFGYFFMYFDDFSKKLPTETSLNQIWMYLHFPLHLCQVAFGISLTDVLSLYEQEKTNVTSEVTAPITHAVSHLLVSYVEASNTTTSSTAPLTISEEGAEPNVNMIFVYKSFLIAGGLIMVLNAFIKMIHTQVSNRYSLLICLMRVVNAIVLWGLIALDFAHAGAIALLGIMTGSLLFQAMVNLLD